MGLFSVGLRCFHTTPSSRLKASSSDASAMKKELRARRVPFLQKAEINWRWCLETAFACNFCSSQQQFSHRAAESENWFTLFLQPQVSFFELDRELCSARGFHP